MKITINLALFFTLALLGLSACSKEKKIERSLQKKDGTWDVVNCHVMSYNDDGTFYGEYNYDNYATFVFHKNGKFEWFSFNTSTDPIHEGTWLNTDEELMINRPGSSLIPGNEAWVFKIVKESKNEMTLHRISRKPDIVVFKDDATYQLKRRM